MQLLSIISAWSKIRTEFQPHIVLANALCYWFLFAFFRFFNFLLLSSQVRIERLSQHSVGFRYRLWQLVWNSAHVHRVPSTKGSCPNRPVSMRIAFREYACPNRPMSMRVAFGDYEFRNYEYLTKTYCNKYHKRYQDYVQGQDGSLSQSPEGSTGSR